MKKEKWKAKTEKNYCKRERRFASVFFFVGNYIDFEIF